MAFACAAALRFASAEAEDGALSFAVAPALLPAAAEPDAIALPATTATQTHVTKREQCKDVPDGLSLSLPSISVTRSLAPALGGNTNVRSQPIWKTNNDQPWSDRRSQTSTLVGTRTRPNVHVGCVHLGVKCVGVLLRQRAGHLALKHRNTADDKTAKSGKPKNDKVKTKTPRAGEQESGEERKVLPGQGRCLRLRRDAPSAASECSALSVCIAAVKQNPDRVEISKPPNETNLSNAASGRMGGTRLNWKGRETRGAQETKAHGEKGS